jgi:hypothetical protein
MDSLLNVKDSGHELRYNNFRFFRNWWGRACLWEYFSDEIGKKPPQFAFSQKIS